MNNVGRQLIVFGANYLIVAAPLAFAISWSARSWLRSLLAGGLGAVAAVVIAAAIGHLWYEARPFVVGNFTPLIHHSADSGFPSDHLSALGAVTAAAWLARRSAGVMALGIAMAVAAARVLAGVHYPVDVVAGFGFGVAAAMLAWYALDPVRDQLDVLDRWLADRGLRPRREAALGMASPK
ncbi:MAG: phosphatase PAP2 family protein [Candidatus Dormibacteria bacterium]